MLFSIIAAIVIACVVLICSGLYTLDKMQQEQIARDEIASVMTLTEALSNNIRSQNELAWLFEGMLKDVGDDRAFLFSNDIRQISRLFASSEALAQRILQNPQPQPEEWPIVRMQCLQLAHTVQDAMDRLRALSGDLRDEKQSTARTRKVRVPRTRRTAEKPSPTPEPGTPGRKTIRGTNLEDFSDERTRLVNAIAIARGKLRASRHPRASEFLRDLNTLERRIDTFLLNNLQGNISQEEKKRKVWEFIAPTLTSVELALREEKAKQPPNKEA